MSMTNLGWGYIGVGVCEPCEKPSYLFVNSDRIENREWCIACYERHFDFHHARTGGEEFLYALQSIPNENTHPILASDDVCGACERPFTDSGSNKWSERTEALLDDNRTIIVHKECSKSWCNNCDEVWAVTNRRSIPRGDTYTKPFRYSGSDFHYPTTVDGRDLCGNCYKEYIEENGGHDMFFSCDSCCELFHQDVASNFGGSTYCERCYENNVHFCEDCEETYWADDGHDCDGESEYVHNYSYKPSPFFFGEDKFHLGFELEIELQRGNLQDVASMVHNSLGARAYMKEDGSLNNGLEIVTHPHTLEAYKLFPWDVLKQLKSYRCRSWNTDTCGLHVHVSRKGFGHTYDREKFDSRTSYLSAVQLSRQAHEFRFMKLIYDNERQITRLAGRTTHYASFDDKGNISSKVKQYHQSNGRYSAVNCENENTLEIRVFRGSLRKERVLSALELVHACVEYTRDLKVNGKDKNLSWLKFTGFVSANVETYPNLALIMNETFSTDNPVDDDVR